MSYSLYIFPLPFFMLGHLCGVCKAWKILLIIGGINWGLMGIGYFLHMNLNVVNLLLGQWPVVENIVYILVGVAALWQFTSGKCAMCKKAGE